MVLGTGDRFSNSRGDVILGLDTLKPHRFAVDFDQSEVHIGRFGRVSFTVGDPIQHMFASHRLHLSDSSTSELPAPASSKVSSSHLFFSAHHFAINNPSLLCFQRRPIDPQRGNRVVILKLKNLEL